MKKVLTLKKYNSVTNQPILDGNNQPITKPNVFGDPDYIPPYEDLIDCPVTTTTTTTTTTTQLPPCNNPAPTNLEIEAVNQGTLRLTWTDNTPTETGFLIQISPDGTNWSNLGNVSQNTTIYDTPTNLIANTRYYFRVKALVLCGDSDYSNIAFGYTLPAPITNFSGSANGNIWEALLVFTENSPNLSLYPLTYKVEMALITGACASSSFIVHKTLTSLDLSVGSMYYIIKNLYAQNAPNTYNMRIRTIGIGGEIVSSSNQFNITPIVGNPLGLNNDPTDCNYWNN